jgi:outer membrane lipoprotein-sorting protein
MVFATLPVLLPVVLATLAAEPGPPEPSTARIAAIVGKMEEAYAQIQEYRTVTDVRTYRSGQIAEERRFLYTFQKPDRIRIELESPHAGTVVTYPDKNGRAVVKPGGWLGFLRLQYSPDSSVFTSSAGQRIDQTDLGLLIRNIGRSVTDQQRGAVEISEQDSQAVISVLADDHFLPGIQTLYRFTVDETLWLPIAVLELTPDGALKRDIAFRNLATSRHALAGGLPASRGGRGDGRFAQRRSGQ